MEDEKNRDDLAAEYLGTLPFDPYPVQEDALLAWFTTDEGVLVCAPTGTGKTVIAEAALFEALKTGRVAYYTTPLIALTEQKFHEIQEKAVSWGFSADDVGLVTGNRRHNPNAKILVVVAEILLNRLLHREQFDFDRVTAVVMDEFHSFSDPERGIVWELSLGMLPKHIRLLLLSATAGNAYEFSAWLRRSHDRDLVLVQSDDRKVPLQYEWVGDRTLPEQIEWMADGDEQIRRTPALIFCFNREECWTVAELLKGKRVVHSDTKAELIEEIKKHDWSEGAGPKLRQILQRGVGVHHAGVLPKYRRIVETLFQRKLLSVTVCTETLAAGINLPARSVVLPTLLKGPRDKKRVVEPSSAHQIFGRAGRPQFDDQGFVYVLAHEDDVKLLHWKTKFDQIPEKTKDPGLLKAKKALKKKMPKRRANQQYWTEAQFEKLHSAAPGQLESRGPLPWRLLAHLLDTSPDVKPIREFISKRLLTEKQVDVGMRQLDRMLRTLYKAGYVTLEPAPPKNNDSSETPNPTEDNTTPPSPSGSDHRPSLPPANPGLFAHLLETHKPAETKRPESEPPTPPYRPDFAHPTERLTLLNNFRSINPLYGVFLINQLGIADDAELLQALDSALEFPASVARMVRVPKQDDLPPGPLATTRLDINLLRLGLVSSEELTATDSDEDDGYVPFEERKWILTLAEKLRMQFQYDFPSVDVRITSVWVTGGLFEYGDNFDKFITGSKLQKQEGIVFRHLLRLVLLINEFKTISPPDMEASLWREKLESISDRITASCQRVDQQSTQKILDEIEVSNVKTTEGTS